MRKLKSIDVFLNEEEKLKERIRVKKTASKSPE
jgi:predicted RNase H-like nuclease